MARAVSASILQAESSSASSAKGFQSTTVNGTTYDYIPGCGVPGSATVQDATASNGTVNFGKRKADEMSEKTGPGSTAIPLDVDSDSGDELLWMPAPSPPSQVTPSTTLATPQSSQAKMSFMDQLATPKGTRPPPRSTTNQPFAPRPALVSASSTVSDDGFVSGASLESRLQGRYGSRELELTPPLSSSQQSSQPPSQQLNSLQSRVKNYSQKRFADPAVHSSEGVRKRTLPPTITKHMQPSPMAMTNAFAQNQALERSRSRSSSPAPSPTSFTQVENGRYTNYPHNRTKEGMLLSDEQQHVLEQVVIHQKNLFFTGSAGTGKSVLLRELIVRLRNKYNNSNPKGRGDWGPSTSSNDAVAVTAPTGIAACNIGGCTLHSFAGAGLCSEAVPVLVAKIRKNGNASRRWQDTKVLIVDEVSMVDAEFMDKLEAIAREIRRDQRPWGGMQIVLSGDFFQLPPVNKSGNVKFCFEGEAWGRSISMTIQLEQVFRQKDQTFADMLNEIRLGEMSAATVHRFSTLTRDLKSDDGLRPTELFPLRLNVEEANQRMLANLGGKTYSYEARDRGPMKEKMEQNCLAPSILNLKVNAQVMLLKNQAGGAGGLVNGSVGVVLGFVKETAHNENQSGANGERKGSLNTPGEELPNVRFTLEGGVTRDMVVGREEWSIELPNGTLQGARIQIPLGLAWSLSIHKSQGQTLPKVRVDLGKVFEKGNSGRASVSKNALQF
ncbi:unnamed protein product [Mortierella alpina]